MEDRRETGEGLLAELAGLRRRLAELERVETERGEVEKALQKAQARSQSLIDAIPDMMFRIGRDGTYLDFEPAKAVAPLVAPEQFLGKKLFEVLPPEVAEKSVHYVRQALRTGHIQTFEYQLSIGSEVRSYEARIAASGSDEAVAIVRDVTTRKQIEQRLLEYQRQLRALTSELSLSEERERRRIAVELHDQIGRASSDF